VSLSTSREACSRHNRGATDATTRGWKPHVCEAVVLLRILRFARSVGCAFLAASCVAVRFGLFLGLIVRGLRVLLASLLVLAFHVIAFFLGDVVFHVRFGCRNVIPVL